ncbi:MAG TPA: glycosyltransferase family 4 protein [Caulobacteraceae bacterium]|nr:glycosyltransferase family 4 protein [Caulobacteraceae bacterium]
MQTPRLRIIDARDPCEPASDGPRRVALIGNFPPRRCGIATFTSDVHDALTAARPGLSCEVYAMTDAGRGYAYPDPVVCEIRQDHLEDYLAAADRINRDPPDVICVQHEFGIFGGPAGEYLLNLLEAVDRPVVTTLHTVLDTPDDDQRRVFERLINRSARVVVMAERGRDFLRDVWRTPSEKIVLIPHGAPDRPFSDTAPFKARLGFAGRELLFTFGLISPNKGIETVIRALPAIAAKRPATLYAVLGATHPNLIAREGEHYRESLIALADELGVAGHVRLIDEYTDTPRLIDYLQAADVYITPYLNVRQITSGTLSYAAALGKPIISTPYWHAEELLTDGLGRLTPFGSAEAIGAQVIDLLSHPDERLKLSRALYQASRETVWSRFGERMIKVFQKAISVARRPPAAQPANAPDRGPNLEGVRRLTDSCGIAQHGLFNLPDRRHGYCVDDNARALMLMHRLAGPADAERRLLTSTYAAFVQHAWNEDTGRFRNFMSYERQWLEASGSDDSTGRATWAVGVTAATPKSGLQRWAGELMNHVLPHLDSIASPRAEAFILLGLTAMLAAGWRDERIVVTAEAKAARLVGLLDRRVAEAQPWFEQTLAYDNARLPEALIRAGGALKRRRLTEIGVQALDWLCARQTGLHGVFLPVATADFGRPLAAYGLFDQQPVEAAATVDAAIAAWEATGDYRWAQEAERAFAWYFGANTLGAPLAAENGGCCDGLTWAGPNENQGAESVLSLQLAAAAIETLTAARDPRVKSAHDL